MPRGKKKEVPEWQQKCIALKHNTIKHMEMKGLDYNDVAAMIGRNPGTVNRKLNHPELFTYWEVQTLFTNLGFSAEEILQSI